MNRLSFILLLATSVCSAELLPFLNDPSYQRDEPSVPWYVHNTGQPSKLYRNGIYISQETGTNDVGITEAWMLRSLTAEEPMIGMVDMTTHGDRVEDILRTVCPCSPVYRYELSRWYGTQVAAGIVDCVDAGCRVIVVTTGFNYPDTDVSNACVYALSQNVVVVCSVPDVDGNLDAGMVDYPYRWHFPHVLPVSSTDRNGNHYSPSATGSLCVAAPGRNIVAAGTYSSGTSYAAPIAAGCVAMLIQKTPWLAAEDYVEIMRYTAKGAAKRVDPCAAIAASTMWEQGL